MNMGGICRGKVSMILLMTFFISDTTVLRLLALWPDTCDLGMWFGFPILIPKSCIGASSFVPTYAARVLLIS